MKSIRLHKMIPVKLLFVNNEARMLEQRDYEVEFSIHTEGEKGQTSGAVSQNKGFQKICYMLNEIINESIVYTPEQIELMEKYFCDYDNNFVVLPMISETMLIECLHSKFNVITDENTYVDFIGLKDKATNLGYSYINDSEEEDYDLPVDNSWIGEFPFWELPWWQRYDSTTFDNTGKDSEEQKIVIKDREDKQVDRLTTLVFEEIDKNVEQTLGDRKSGEIVDLEEIRKLKKSKWKPTLV
tara:strand:- start:2534 stop:3256 length:723 start_codon:yes stop_codon:yes gene_type:complete